MGQDDSPATSPESAVQQPGSQAVGAFQRLGNETRLAILVALWEEVEPFTDDNAVSFSTLRQRVGLTDSGQFTYHLDQLTDTFVLQTDAGYQLSPTGLHIVAAVIAGTGTSDARLGPVEVEVSCPLCDGPVETHVEDAMMSARCTQCAGLWNERFGTEGLLFRFGLPPAAIEGRTPTDIFRTTVTYNLNRLRSFRNGVCPVCAGPVEHTFDVCESHPDTDELCPACNRRHLSEILIACKRCKSGVRDPVFMAALNHPAVTAFLYEHDVTTDTDSWEAFALGVSASETLVSTDPLRVRITIPYQDDEVSVLLRGEEGISDFVLEA